ncbi:DUF998 domain-containing protein [Nonomuraea harbinensis]|uniref:DUF998 domain-containing protein n=1 Tax=Nonomuraea harbinensis TaxID=1286938 RepID=A0ABW1C416_9ACTN|nr:DUF998 domain-containing protein [Nonomuraea harbinensis]
MTGVTEELPATEADADVEGPRPRGGVAGRPAGGLPAGSRAYPLVALAAIVCGVAGIGFAQLDSDLNPLHVTVSEYAVADRGGVTEVAMAVVALGSLALLAGLRSVGAPVRGMPERLLLVWSGALLVAAAVPTAPFGADPTFAAQVHRYVSIAAFVSLPAAGALLVPRLARDPVWRPVARVVEWLALAGGLGVLAITYVALPGERVMIGLVERALLGAEVALLAVLAAWLVRVVWVSTTVKITTYHRFIAS